ncbi:GNAT family N-acetyltransferase [Congregibacter litoralis]|uniref:Acetyltransferase n=1 Tax=Congregibacter litoralis KT71 TaxID=314285 RepID=A4AA19_9GAMM|nr:GNAT family protein [Congregibacter litoralis]EAQ97336.1 Acetyltransferase [Congregibacter litoralis KT71]
MPWPDPVSLEGEFASLVPLQEDHADALALASGDGEVWRAWYTNVPAPADVAAEIARRLGEQRAGRMLPFTVLDQAGVPAGMTTYMNIDATSPRVEIGSTWYAKRVQRTSLNTQCKRLLLAHAFESLGCIAVEFRTSSYNRASRRAIERIGAKADGILRNHSRHQNGTLRDTCVYSILDSEWPGVKAQLDHMLGFDAP